MIRWSETAHENIQSRPRRCWNTTTTTTNDDDDDNDDSLYKLPFNWARRHEGVLGSGGI